MSNGSVNHVPPQPFLAEAFVEIPVTSNSSPEVSINPPFPITPSAWALKTPSATSLLPQFSTLPPLPSTLPLALSVLERSMVVEAEVGILTRVESCGSNAACAALPVRGFALKSRPVMMLPPPPVPLASSVAPVSVVLMRPDCTIVPPKPAPPLV